MCRRILLLVAALAAVAGFHEVANAQTMGHYLRDFRAANPSDVRFTAFATGSLSDVVNGEDVASPAGSVGLQVGLQRWYLQGNIALGAGQESLTDGFGSRILSPNLAASGPSAILEGGWPRVGWLGNAVGDSLHWGLAGYLSWTEATWATTGTVPQAVDAAVGGWGLYALHWISGADATALNEAGLSLGFGIFGRYLASELRQDEVLRQTLLGSPRASFHGLEGFMALTVNRLTVYTQSYWTAKSGGIRGISGVNATFGMSVRGHIFKLDMPRAQLN